MAGIFKQLLLLQLRYLIKTVKLFCGIGEGVCRFQPSCSEYCIQSFKKYSPVKAGARSLWRLVRCNPLNTGGYDPVDKSRT